MDKSLHMRINYLNLTVFGIIPIKLRSDTLQAKIGQYAHWVYCFVYMTIFCLFVMSAIYELINVAAQKNLFEFASNLGVSWLYFIAFIKVCILDSGNLHLIYEEIQEQEKAIMNGVYEDWKTIYMNHVNYNRKISLFYLSMGYSTYVLFFAMPILDDYYNTPSDLYTVVDNNTLVYIERPLAFSNWFPFDKYKYYYTTYIIHMVAGFIGTTVASVIIAYYALIVYGLGQIAITQYCFKNFKKYADVIALDRQCSVDEASEIFLKIAIKLHEKTIRYFQTLDEHINVISLMDFIGTTVQVAVIGFQVIVLGGGWRVVFILAYCLAMIVQLIIYYYLANEVLLQSSHIQMSIWESDWTDSSTKVKKILLMVMQRANKPICLYVGSFYPISTETALTLMRGSYSYVALLRQFYKR